MAKYYITPTLLNSWQYNIKNGTLEDFIKVLNKEEFEPSESILKGFEFEKYMQENYEETLNGSYQVKVSKEYGDYLLSNTYAFRNGTRGKENGVLNNK